MHPTNAGERPEDVRTYLRLSRLLDQIQHHPEVSAPLRLALFRARRDGRIDSLDEAVFRAAVADAGRTRPGRYHANRH